MHRKNSFAEKSTTLAAYR